MFCVAGALAATALGLPMPWTEARDYGVPREIPVQTAAEAPADVDEPRHVSTATRPPYLTAHLPAHLESDETVDSEDDESPATMAAGSGRESATTATPQTAPTTTVAMTTTTAPVTTTTVAPPTTTTTTPPATTLPGPKPGTPVAVADTFTIPADDSVRLRVLGNDSDPDGDIGDVTLTILSGPSHARRFTHEGDHFRYKSYKPHRDEFSPTDSFVYQICDDSGQCATASVTVIIDY